MEEVICTVSKLQNGKDCGLDNIPNEITKLEELHNVKHHIYSTSFNIGSTPEDWNLFIITD